jgi:arabinofuranan 3-O-arabinosyltransferase
MRTSTIPQTDEAEEIPPKPANGKSVACLDPLNRWILAALGAGFLVVTSLQSSGLIEEDTKLPLIMAPLAYMQSSLHLWSQNTYSGTVQSQTFGFLLPMGPFFALTHVLHVPTWCAERIWLALLLTVGCWGIIRLAEALGIGKRWARVLAGVAYCAAPIVVTWAAVSVDLLAVMLLPWVLVPLVAGSRSGSTRRAAARSGLAVALMGGVNATVIVATLPVAVVWLLTRQPGPRRRSLIGWWIVAVGLACFWWAFSIVLQGRYGYNFLPYSETPTTTLSTASAFEALRGASNWIGYDTLGGTVVPGAWTLVSSPVAIVGTTIVTALGLAGLCRRIPERLFLITSLCVGVVAIAAGYAGASGGPFSLAIRELLGNFEAFRNVSKFSPDVALPLALGLAWAISVKPWERVGKRMARLTRSGRVIRPTIGTVAVVAVFLAAMPFWRAQLYPSGGFAKIPQYWSQAATWLTGHQGKQTALLVPGAAFAEYSWGRPFDEPLQILSDVSFETRSLIPTGSNGNTLMLTAVEQALDNGTSTPGLARFISRAGIDYVVERNDLNWRLLNAPPPAQVHQVLSETAGLVEVATFGPLLPKRQVANGALPVYPPADLHLPPIEIFRVDPPASEIRTYPANDPLIVSGSTDSLLPLAGAGVLANRAAVLAGDPLGGGATSAPQATWAITDGNQRRDTSFGSIHNNVSYLLGPNQRTNTAQQFVPQGFIVVPGVQHQTVEDPIGVKSIAASSYASTLSNDPYEGPAAAFDGNPATAWLANATNDSIGQWISITFTHPLDLTTITVDPLSGVAVIPAVRRVTISTDRGSAQRSLPVGTAPVQLTVPRGVTRYLTIRIDAVSPASQVSAYGPIGAGFAGVSIPGVSFVQRMKVPNDEASAFSGSQRQPPIAVFSSPLPSTTLTLGSSESDDSRVARLVTLPKGMGGAITGSVVPMPGAALESLLEKLMPPLASPLLVSAGSWLSQLPQFRPANLVQRSASPWIAGLTDTKPYINLAWGKPTNVGSVDLTLSPQAAAPTEISITDGRDTRVAEVPHGGGIVTFAPMMTTGIRIRFLHVAREITTAPYDGVEIKVQLPVGLTAVSIPALALPAAVPTPPSTKINLPCGQGPTVEVDGTGLPSSVSGTLGDLLSLQPAQFTACTPPGGTPIAAGAHTIQVSDAGTPFAVTSLVVRDAAPTPRTIVATARKATIERWGPEFRTVGVSDGPSTYLAVAQNYNDAWVAKFGNRTLAPVRLDGWQQGWVVPAGSAGTVTMTMVPDALFRHALELGAGFLVMLLLLALIPARRSVRDPAGPRPLPRFGLIATATALVLILVSGPLALLAVPLLFMARRWGGLAMAMVAAGAFAVSGVLVAWHAGALPETGTGAFGRPAQIAAVIALAALLCALAAESRGWRVPVGRHSSPSRHNEQS